MYKAATGVASPVATAGTGDFYQLNVNRIKHMWDLPNAFLVREVCQWGHTQHLNSSYEALGIVLESFVGLLLEHHHLACYSELLSVYPPG